MIFSAPTTWFLEGGRYGVFDSLDTKGCPGMGLNFEENLVVRERAASCFLPLIDFNGAFI